MEVSCQLKNYVDVSSKVLSHYMTINLAVIKSHGINEHPGEDSEGD